MSYLKASIRNHSAPIMVGQAAMYNDPVKNTIYIAFHHVAIVLALFVNITLVTLIVKCRRKEFGAYRFLLLTFASVDIYYGLVHFLVMPIPETWANAFYMGAHGYITGKVAVCWFASAHSHSFVVLVFHFLYRLLAVKGSCHIELFTRRWFFGFQFMCVFLVGGAWFCVLYFLFDADEFVVAYMEPILREHAIGVALPFDQYSTAVFWPIFGFVVMATTMSGGYGFMMHAAYKIGWHMKRTSVGQSERTSELQKQLMRALMYQTILPLVTAYSPPLISVVNPFLGISLSFIADISPIFCGTHPWLDGCVLIWTIKEYRMMLLRCISKGKKSREGEMRTTTRTGNSVIAQSSIVRI